MSDCRSIRFIILTRNKLIERVLLNIAAKADVLQNDKSISLECSPSNNGGVDCGEKLIQELIKKSAH